MDTTQITPPRQTISADSNNERRSMSDFVEDDYSATIRQNDTIHITTSMQHSATTFLSERTGNLFNQCSTRDVAHIYNDGVTHVEITSIWRPMDLFDEKRLEAWETFKSLFPSSSFKIWSKKRDLPLRKDADVDYIQIGGVLRPYNKDSVQLIITLVFQSWSYTKRYRDDRFRLLLVSSPDRKPSVFNRGVSLPISWEPQMNWNPLNPLAIVNTCVAEATDDISDLVDSVKSRLNSFDFTNGNVNELIDIVKTKLKGLNVEETKHKVFEYADSLKENVDVSRLTNTLCSSGAIVAACSATAYMLYNRDQISITVFVLSVILLFIFAREELAKLFDIVKKFWHKVWEPQAVGLDMICESLVMFMVGSALKTTPTAKLPAEMLKHLSGYSRIKDNFESIAKYFIEVVHMIASNIGLESYLPVDLRYLHVQQTDIRAYSVEVDQIFKLVAEDGLPTTEENFERLNNISKRGEEFLVGIPNTPKTNGIKQLITEQRRRIQTLIQQFIDSNYALLGTRIEPASMMLMGAPGNFKSQCIDHIVGALCQLSLSEAEAEEAIKHPELFVYYRDPVNGFYDGYSGKKFITVHDDAFQRLDPGCTIQEGMEFIREINEFPAHLHMSAVKDKAATFFRSKYVLATTNLSDITQNTLVNSVALKRRFDRTYVVYPKPEYCSDATMLQNPIEKVIDPKKLPMGPRGITSASPNAILFQERDKITRQHIGGPKTIDEIIMDIYNIHRIKVARFEQKTDQVADRRVTYKRIREILDMQGDFDIDMFDPESCHTTNDVPLVTDEIAHYVDDVRSTSPFKEVRADRYPHAGWEPQGKWDPTKLVNMSGITHKEVDYVKFDVDRDKFDQFIADLFMQLHEVDEDPESEADKTAFCLFIKDVYVAATRNRKLAGFTIQKVLAILCRKYGRIFADALVSSDKEIFILLDDVKEDTLIERFYPKIKQVSGGVVYTCERVYHAIRSMFSNIFSDAYYKLVELSNYIKYNPTHVMCYFVIASIGLSMLQKLFRAIGSTTEIFTKAAEDTHEHIQQIIKEGESLGFEYLEEMKDLTPEQRNARIDDYIYLSKLTEEEHDQEMAKRKEARLSGQSYHMRSAPTPKSKTPAQYRARLNAQMGHVMDKSGVEKVNSIRSTNLYSFYIGSPDDSGLVGTIVGLRGRSFLFCNHYIDRIDKKLEQGIIRLDTPVFVIKKSHGSEALITRKFTIEDILNGVQGTKALTKADGIIVVFPNKMPPVSDIIPNFATQKAVDKLKAVNYRLVNNTPTDRVEYQGVATKNAIQQVDYVDGVKGHYFVYDVFEYSANTEKGDCGSLFTVLNPADQKHKIFGIHVAGSTDGKKGCASIITQELLLEALEQVPIEDRIVQTVDDTFESQMGSLIGNGKFPVLREAPKAIVQPGTTKIVPSLLHGAWGPSTCAPAKLKPFYNENDILINPMEDAISKYCTDDILLNQADVDIVFDSLYDSLMFNSKIAYNKSILTYDESILGLDDDCNFNSIARETSPGYPLNMEYHPGYKKKEYWFGRDADYNLDTEAGKQLRKQCEMIIALMKEGIRSEFIFVDFLKEETRSLQKVLDGKTRLVSGCALAYLIVFRQYFGRFTSWIIHNRIENGCGVGVNPYSYEWEILKRRMSQFDCSRPNIGAGDYKGFDASGQPQIYNGILAMINKWYGGSKEDELVRKVLWLDLCHSRHINGKNIYDWPSSLPSGHPLTTIANCLYNLFAFRYCFYKAVSRDTSALWEFNSIVYVIVFGDDNLFAVRGDYVDLFNEMTIPTFMKELGLQYTNEAKGTSVVKMRYLEEVSFLKRGFRREKYVNSTVAPLDIEVILEMPYWTKKGADSETITKDNITFALNELSLHGEVVYDKFKDVIVGSCVEKMDYHPPKTNWYETINRVGQLEKFF